MEVTGPGGPNGPAPIGQVRPSTDSQPVAPTQNEPIRDEVEFTSLGQKLESLSQTSDLRTERLEQIRAAIEAGVYETPEKLEKALDRLLDEIRSDKS